MNKRKWLAIVLALAMVLTMLPAMAMADETTVSNVTDLQEAIADSGVTKITISYDINLDNNTSFTIDRPLEIVGADGQKPVISVNYTENNNIALFTFLNGSAGSKLENIQINITAPSEKTKRTYAILFNNYTDNTAQTIINDIVIDGGDTLKTIAIAASGSSTGGNIKVTNSQFKNLSYGIYLDNISDFEFTENTIDNTNYNAINLGEDGGSDITISNNKFTNISQAGYEYDEYSSGIRIGEKAIDVTVSENETTMLNDKKAFFVDEEHQGVKIGDTYYNTLEKAIAVAGTDDVIELTKDITVTSNGAANAAPAIDINKQITLEGNGNKIIAKDFALTAEQKLANSILQVNENGDGTVIQNLTIEGDATTKHAINLFGAENVQILDVTVESCGGSGLVVNNSTATTDNFNVLSCGANWNAVDVDNGSTPSGGVVTPTLALNKGSIVGNISASADDAANITLDSVAVTGTVTNGDNEKEYTGQKVSGTVNEEGTTVKKDSSGSGYVQQKTLTFDTNGGSKIDAVTANYGKTIVLSEYTPKRSGYDFAGWYKDKELTEKIEQAILDYDMTIYAKWSANGEPTEDADVETQIVLVINDKTAVVDGKAVTNDVGPIIVNGRTYTPARFVAEALGAKVDWNEAAKTVTITKGDTSIVLIVDTTTAYVNGEAVKMDASAFIADGRTFTPCRFVAEQLGANVEWDEATRSITIIQYAE